MPPFHLGKPQAPSLAPAPASAGEASKIPTARPGPSRELFCRRTLYLPSIDGRDEEFIGGGEVRGKEVLDAVDGFDNQHLRAYLIELEE